MSDPESGGQVDPVQENEDFRKECSHYSRGCSFVSPCCGKVYPCRLCHNDNELSHQIDRHAVVEVICRKCSKRQPVSEKCQDCELVFGRYFCEVCRLYDDAEKGQFHCDKCGLCRVGGQDNFFHCDTCGFCLGTAMRELHKCRKQMSKDNCPVCMEDIHTSRTAAHVPQCGHLIHMTCYRELMTNGLYQCPQCQTSITDMSSHWRSMDAEKEAWQLPQHLQDFKVKVNCRDCHKETETNFHVVGLKCSDCGSYNTVRCGNEEIPEDNNQGEGMLGQLMRRLRGRGGGQEGGARRRRRRNQGGDDEETDSDSDTDVESNTSNDSDHRPDRDGGNDATGSLDRHDNDQPDKEEGSRDPNCDSKEDAPSNQVNDDGVVDDASYDGDESDGCEEDESNSSSNEEDLFFDCRSRLSKTPLRRRIKNRRGNATRVFTGRPIEVPAGNEPGALQWWESEGEDSVDCIKPKSTATFPPTRSYRHDNTRSRYPHSPVRVLVERVQVLEIWGSDFYTDSFSEVSSDGSASSWETEEEEVMIGGVVCSRQQPVLKKGPSCSTNNCSGQCETYCVSEHCSAPIRNGHMKAPTICNEEQLYVKYPSLNGYLKETSSMQQRDNASFEKRNCLVSKDVENWVRRSSSEDSWVTANEDWELGTLV